MNNPFFISSWIWVTLWIILGLAGLFIALTHLLKARNKKARKDFIRITMLVAAMITVKILIYSRPSEKDTGEFYQGFLGMSVSVSVALFIVLWMAAWIYISFLADKMLESSGRSKAIRYATSTVMSLIMIGGLSAMYLVF